MTDLDFSIEAGAAMSATIPPSSRRIGAGTSSHVLIALIQHHTTPDDTVCDQFDRSRAMMHPRAGRQ
jgi:hypothetical protein